MLNVSSKTAKALLWFTVLLSPAGFGRGEQSEEAVIPGLPNCNDNEIPSAEISKRLLYVSTLDGKVSALDLSNAGKIKWTVDTDGQLLSSSIHKLELTSNGKWSRLIPSLSGGLYKFDGDNIEAIPIKAEDLLRSSFKFSDDIVMSGGIETKSYGISARTGAILYECNLNGCQNYTHSTEPIGPKEDQYNPIVDDIIILRRETQTVRAIEPREGIERWNFSIGMHEMELIKSKDCQGRGGGGPSEIDLLLSDLEFKAVIPEGIVCAFSKKNPNQILWMHQFSTPIVRVWKSNGKDKIENVDLFNTADWLWNGSVQKKSEIFPSIYLGMHDKQPYIQESDRQLVVRQNTSPAKIIGDDYGKIPFKPYPATKEAVALIEDYSSEEEKSSNNEIIEKEENPTALANSVLYASEYVNGNGFYFYTTTDLNKTTGKEAICQPSDGHDHHNVEDASFIRRTCQILYKWKEVFVFIVTAAVFVVFFVNNRPHEKEYVVVEKHIPVPFAREALEGVNYSKGYNSQNSSSESSYSGENYQSRFVMDYEVMQVLGKGGFGVVFAAKNKVDDCHYAIKRIVLPNKQESRERVMREVKTLAHLEHQNIVRYFSSWVETPPEKWQEEHDKNLQRNQLLSTSIDIGTPSETTSATNFTNYDHQNRKLTSDPSGILPQFVNFQKNTFNDVDFSKPGGNNFSEEDSSGIVFGDYSKKSSDIKPISLGNNTNGDSSIVFKDDTGDKQSSKIQRPTSLDLSDKTKDMIFSFTQTKKAYLYIQMQLCHKNSLKEWLSHKKYQERAAQVVPIFEQIVGAVEYCHLKGLIHRDLKPSNIFFSLDGQIKVGDFGLVTDMAEESNPVPSTSSSAPSLHTKRVGTSLYMAPEQERGLNYNYKIDIYSLGLILFELYSTFGTEMERINSLKQLRSNNFPKEFKTNFEKEFNLLQLMLSEHPVNRPTTFGIRARPPLQHSIVQNDEWHFELPPRPRRESSNGTGGIAADFVANVIF